MRRAQRLSIKTEWDRFCLQIKVGRGSRLSKTPRKWTEGGGEEEGGCDVGFSDKKRFADEEAVFVGVAGRVGDVERLEVTRSRGRMRGGGDVG